MSKNLSKTSITLGLVAAAAIGAVAVAKNSKKIIAKSKELTESKPVAKAAKAVDALKTKAVDVKNKMTPKKDQDVDGKKSTSESDNVIHLADSEACKHERIRNHGHGPVKTHVEQPFEVHFDNTVGSILAAIVKQRYAVNAYEPDFDYKGAKEVYGNAFLNVGTDLLTATSCSLEAPTRGLLLVMLESYLKAFQIALAETY